MSNCICPSCDMHGMEVFHVVRAVPTNSCLLLSTPQEARDYPRGDIELGFCGHCGFISNVVFDEALTEYSGRYEETQGFSPTFNEFHRRLAESLIDRYALRGKKIIEIGCGKGEFLHLLCGLGANCGVGFDPGYLEGRSGDVNPDVQVIKDFYSEKYANYKGDFVCCKMTLEHIHKAADFVSTVRHTVDHKDQGIAFFQVPDSIRILRDCAFEDIYYEHCSYFSPGSLARLFRRCGFEVLQLETAYADQYLTIEAKANGGAQAKRLPQENDLEVLKSYVATFPTRYQRRIGDWRRTLSQLRATNQKVVVWGSGSKGVSFLTTLGIGDQIAYVVDVNPNRHGFYMAGTGQEIVSPEFLRHYQPDAVILMNRVYLDEVSRNLAHLELNPHILTL